jgi:hypothetical protein
MCNLYSMTGKQSVDAQAVRAFYAMLKPDLA